MPADEGESRDTMASTAAATAASATSASQCAKKAVDRSWLSKLLAAHAHKLDPTFPCCTDPILRGKALVVAPMVDQSDLPFRLLCRRYGANLAYTPMIHARLFCERQQYRDKFWDFVNGVPEADRPLVAQFCGSDPKYLLPAMKAIQHAVDAVDINCGCPQGIARKGHYGAFLLESPTLPDLVQSLAAELDVPVTVKVRILPSGVEDSLTLYEKLVDAGAALITVHGRTRHQNKQLTGSADWDAIRRTVERIGHRVPVIANGSIADLDDVRECIRQTGVDGVMSSEALLEYPALFLETNTKATEGRRTGPGRVQLAREFLDLCREHPPEVGGQASGLKCIRAHVHKMLHADLQGPCIDVRDLVAFHGKSMEVIYDAVKRVEDSQAERGHKVEDEQLTWYTRHRHLINEDGENKKTENETATKKAKIDEATKATKTAEDRAEEEEADAALGAGFFGADDGEQCGQCGGDY